LFQHRLALLFVLKLALLFITMLMITVYNGMRDIPVQYL
jgi:hypothetical protein